MSLYFISEHYTVTCVADFCLSAQPEFVSFAELYTVTQSLMRVTLNDLASKPFEDRLETKQWTSIFFLHKSLKTRKKEKVST